MANWISGPYTATWNALAIGNVEEGFRPRWTFENEEIRADNMGLTVQELVYLGANMFIDFIVSEYKAAAVATLIWPYGTKGTIGQVGRMGIESSLVKAFVATAVAGTPAATFPASLTASNTIIANGHQIEQRMHSGHRKFPVSLRVLPNSSGVLFVEA